MKKKWIALLIIVILAVIGIAAVAFSGSSSGTDTYQLYVYSNGTWDGNVTGAFGNGTTNSTLNLNETEGDAAFNITVTGGTVPTCVVQSLDDADDGDDVSGGNGVIVKFMKDGKVLNTAYGNAGDEVTIYPIN